MKELPIHHVVSNIRNLIAFCPWGAIARPPKSRSVFGAANEDECPKGIHIVGVRGTLEKAGVGAMQDVVDQLKQKLSGSDDFAIDYPASGITIDDDGNPKYNFH